ncbi:hypothetical protein DEJ30_12010 [Curtobacterium sp. MCPF17_003]|uniref:hypothetical protein n=1 Tax=Curtobacterium sp. MCPF17_003 TaxID=2175637 RepID=UPI000D8D41E7|nr:hypothetical protein [Curtobacterium sp. MCPF17_003]PYY63631.1 hypothetical protein DEJ30_12010 [Curtobacterium sp. MCPF17_003]
MTADTTPTPNELLTRIAEASRAGMVEELRSIVNELPVPTPPPSTLRIIDIDHLDAFIRGWFDADPESQEISRELREDIGKQFDMPEPMTVIEQAIREWKSRGGMVTTESLLVGIRAALEGATQ